MLDNPLKQIIIDRITRQGPISFAAFMQMALYHPEFGYYMSNPARSGARADYYTSPQLHPIFGTLLAIQLDEMRSLMGKPEGFTILEIGAGNGSLAAGVIDHIHKKLEWKKRWHYLIVEKNPLVRNAQRETLKDFTGRVIWKASLDEVEAFCGCVVSNELLDAFPVHLIVMQDRYREIFVGWEDNRFTEVYGDFSRAELADYVDNYRIPPIKGYRTEVNLKIRDYIAKVGRLLTDGFVITIDYGYRAHQYYAPERNRGTLMCYYRHTAADNPYCRVGKQDITAHVNFTSLKDWGQTSGLQCLGYCTQGSLLASLGGGELGFALFPAGRASVGESLKIKNLLLDMGTTHQVMIQSKGRRNVGPLKGFEISNRMRFL